MRITEKSVYVGPNLYARFPVIRFVVDLEKLEEWPTAKLGDTFIDGLLEALPGLHEHGCSYRTPGGFVRRMREDEGTWLGHVLEHVAIELQNVAGAAVTFGKTRSTGNPREYTVVYQFEEAEVGVEAGRLALRLLHSLLPDDLRSDRIVGSDFDFAEKLESFIKFAQRRSLGPSTAALVKAARDRNIPWLRLNEYSLVQFGHGKYQKRIQATVTSETRHIAVEIASDKEETNKILADLGLPVPRQFLVRQSSEAVEVAERIGYPVVVKPLNANHGRGVSINLKTPDEVRTAFDHAQARGRTILVEKFIEGFDHRLLVIDGTLVAASKRVPGHVIGDGKSTIEQLVEITNQDPRRGVGHEKVLTRLEFDHQAERLLGQLGYDHDTVPPEGEIVYLRSTGNLSTGGTATDVTDKVHPDIRDMAERAARAVGLDVAGVDFLTTDISESYKITGGAICEVNAAPGFRMHTAPSDGEPRDVAEPVMEMLFPAGTPTRIPIAAITGTNGKTTTARMVAHIQKLSGKTVGLTTTDGVYIDGRLTVEGDMTGSASARMVLRDPSVDAAVLETARGGLLKRGLGYKRCDVGVCLNVAADHLGLRGINTVEELAEVKRIVIEAARDTAVLNADDPLCLQMADYSQAEVICYVTMDPTNELVKEHIAHGNRAVVLESGMRGHLITIYDKELYTPLLWAHQIPATLEGRAMHNVQNAMFAVATAYSLGVGLEDIRLGLQTFDTTYFQAPGRMNICDEHPFKVILDYGHNPHAVETMTQVATRIDVTGKRIVVVAAPGDRRDEDIAAIAKGTAGHFDKYICREDDHRRGREPGEIPALLQKSLIENGVSPDAIELIPDEVEAVARALSIAEEGDLVLAFGDDIERSWRQIIEFNGGGSGEGRKESRSAEERSQPGPGGMLQPLGDTPSSPRTSSSSYGPLIRDERGVRIARETED